MRFKPYTPIALACLLFASAPHAHGFVAAGTIEDSAGAAVSGIYVKVMDYEPIGSDVVIAEVKTNASGFYTTAALQSGHDVYIKVDYQMDLSTTYAPGQCVQVLHYGGTSSSSNPGSVVTVSTLNMASGYYPNTTSSQVIDIPTTFGGTALDPDYILVLKQVQDTFEYLDSEGVTGFSFSNDLKVTHFSNAANNSVGKHSAGYIYLGNPFLTNPYTISHEVAHAMHYRARGNNMPPSAYGGSHQRDDESDEGFALKEGWAEALGDLAGAPGAAPAHAWRGDPGGNLNTNTDSGSDNNGEIVEGAICEIMKDGTTSFRYWAEGVLTVSPGTGDYPDTFRDVWGNYVSRSGGTPHVEPTFPVCQKYGIVWARGKVALPDSPPSSSGPDVFNIKRITKPGDEFVFVRGEIEPTKDKLTDAQLRLPPGSRQELYRRYELGTKEATPGNGENNTAFGAFNWHADETWGGTAIVDTRTLDDGGYDLIIKVRNGWDFWDDFNPTFDGDPNGSYDTDEKWLQHQGTWFADDLNGDSSLTDNERQMMVDNTAPVVNAASRKPAPN